MEYSDIKNKQKITDDFNGMTFEQRGIAGKIIQTYEIRDLLILRDRVKANYQREMKWINDNLKSRIKNINLPN